MPAPSRLTLLRRPVAAILVEDEARYRSTRIAHKGDLCVHVLGEEVVVALGPQLYRGAAYARPDMERPVLQRDVELQAWRELVDAYVWCNADAGNSIPTRARCGSAEGGTMPSSRM